MKQLSNKTAFVTGGTRGIGEAISKKLKIDGHTVVVNYGSNEEAAKEFSEQNNIDAYKCDVGDYDSCSKMISNIYDKYKTIDFNKKVKPKNLMLHAYKIKFIINNIKYNFKADYNLNFQNFLKKNF